MINALEINNLKKSYNTEHGEINAIDNIDLTIKKGEFIAIVGPSGCGKSTLLSILAGLENPTDGSFKYDKDSPVIGYMLQQDTLFPWLNILNNTLVGQKIRKKVDKEYALKLLNNYGLKDFIYKKPNVLSGGMKQRVALIRTLAINPDILLLDEPFNALDYQSRLSVSESVYNIIKKEKKTTVMVTHDLAEAISMADRIVVLSKRPSKVKNIYEINFEDRSTPIKNRQKEEFPIYYETIWKDLDINV